MTIVNCPKCRERVTIPPKASSEALVRCPLCQEEFPLAEALIQLPPELIVLDDPQSSLSPGSARQDQPSVLADLAALDVRDQGERGGDAADEMAAAPAFQFEAGSVPARSARVAGSGRGRRRQKSTTKFIAQVVGGGVAGVTLAQLILWWIPLDVEVAQRDFIGIGRKYGRYIPFLVPARVRETGAPGSPRLIDQKDEKQTQTPPSVGSPAPEIPDFPFAESHLKTTPGGDSDRSSPSNAEDAAAAPADVGPAPATDSPQKKPTRPAPDPNETQPTSPRPAAGDKTNGQQPEGDAPSESRGEAVDPSLESDTPKTEPQSPATDSTTDGSLQMP